MNLDIENDDICRSLRVDGAVFVVATGKLPATGSSIFVSVYGLCEMRT